MCIRPFGLVGSNQALPGYCQSLIDLSLPSPLFPLLPQPHTACIYCHPSMPSCIISMQLNRVERWLPMQKVKSSNQTKRDEAITYKIYTSLMLGIDKME